MLEPSTTTIPLTSRRSAVSWCACLVALALLAIVPGHAEAADESLRTVAVADPYLELHTGPGRGYPIFHVVDRGQSVEITMQRTDWYKVRAKNGVEGWVDRAQMELTLQPDGQEVDFEQADLDDFTDAKWEVGILAGDFGGANIISLYTGY